ncbi:nucleoside hydrolase [Shouchella tritolerans]|uniref:nucleoside hydrolase n=1 Tax=Shouchella tritolerans TaxID=2979466 RepID=UPI0021E94E1A|nr:nucleoside hydrolase [Shouchella tritolerans]
MANKLLVFADTGIDDAMAIIYALQHPDVELAGIVADFGNVSRDQALRNASYLLSLADQKGVPVIAGATRALSGEEPEFFPDIHGEEGLGPIRPPIPAEHYADRTNFSRLFQVIKENSDEITIVVLGRCTTLAMAWIINPAVMKRVKATFLMGGAFLVPGNETELAEANFLGDATAANFVCTHAPNVTIVPLNVTRDALLTPADVNLIDSKATTPLLRTIKPLLDFYYESYQVLEPGIQGTPQHDLTALMAAMDIPNLLDYKRRNVQVEDQGRYSSGLSVADFRPASAACSGPYCPRIAVRLDFSVFRTNVLDVLTRN